jgi:competence ComEA-like helix-hairpin-helix protein
MPPDSGDATPDWTTGPAKWAAVVFLSLSSTLGIGWSILDASRVPAPAPLTRASAFSATPDAPSDFRQPPEPLAVDAPIPLSPRRLINLNTATAAELELLPSVGPAVAQRIIEHRAAHGPFKRVEDLDNVKGIGPRTLDKLRDLVAVN